MKDEEKNEYLNPDLPEDARLIKTSGPWSFYFSNSNKALYVETGDYHAGPLKLTKDELLQYAIAIETWSEERERMVLNELKHNPELLAQMELLILKQRMKKD